MDETGETEPAPGEPARLKRQPLRRPPGMDIETEMRLRLLADWAKLPRICVLRRCRRYRQCWGNTIECIAYHTGLVEARLAGAEISPEDATATRRLVQQHVSGRG